MARGARRSYGLSMAFDHSATPRTTRLPDARLVAAAVLLLSSGCAYRVELISTPSPAQVHLPDGRVVTTPTEATFRWEVNNEQVVHVSAPGHRPFAVDLRDHEIRFTRYITDVFTRWGRGRDEARGQVWFILVPAHGPVGTWDPQEVD